MCNNDMMCASNKSKVVFPARFFVQNAIHAGGPSISPDASLWIHLEESRVPAAVVVLLFVVVPMVLPRPSNVPIIIIMDQYQ